MNTPTSIGHRNTLRRLLVRLSRKSTLVPEKLLVKGVVCDNRDPLGGGHFADIYEAQYRDRKVALKRLRSFRSSKEDHIQVKKSMLSGLPSRSHNTHRIC